jgi:hypothetical protein
MIGMDWLRRVELEWRVSRSHGGINYIDIVELAVIYLSSETKRRQGKMTIELNIPRLTVG